MTDVARRQARSQKQRLDTALLDRRRRDALADLGENLYELAASGEIELEELPELAQGVRDVEEIDRQISEAQGATRAGLDTRRPVRLERTRRSGKTGENGSERERVWRPPRDPEPHMPAPRPVHEAPPPRARPSGSAGGGGIVFVADDAAPAGVDPDDSLESYMREDDVPRRR